MPVVVVVRSCITLKTAVPFWGRTSQLLSSLSPIRDCGAKKVKRMEDIGTDIDWLFVLDIDGYILIDFVSEVFFFRESYE